jgi:hypothetical protein
VYFDKSLQETYSKRAIQHTITYIQDLQLVKGMESVGCNDGDDIVGKGPARNEIF